MQTSRQPYHKKNYSIQRALSALLLLLVTLTMFILGGLTYWQGKRQANDWVKIQMINSAEIISTMVSSSFTDSRLKKLSTILHKLAPDANIKLNPKNTHAVQKQQLVSKYANIFGYQVYDKRNDHLIIHSKGASGNNINQFKAGFHAYGRWFLYVKSDEDSPYKVVVFIQDALQHDLLIHYFIWTMTDMLLIYFSLLLLSYLTIKFALRPLQRILKTLSARDARKLEPIDAENAPSEILPLLSELNTLIFKVNEVIEREKRFTGDAAHELKTPIAGLSLQAELAYLEENPVKMKQKLSRIIAQLKSYSQIIENMLLLTRLEPRHDLPDSKLINLVEHLQQVIADFIPIAMQKDIEINLHTTITEASVMGSDVFLGILFRNLLENAYKFSKLGQQIHIYLKAEGEQYSIYYKDEAGGVEEGELKRIFDRYYRIVDRKEPGSGLGLSIVKEIMRLHQGTVTAYNQDNPKGLVILLQFPMITCYPKS